MPFNRTVPVGYPDSQPHPKPRNRRRLRDSEGPADLPNESAPHPLREGRPPGHGTSDRTGHYRVGAVCGVLGPALLIVGTLMHPVPEHLNDPATAFAAYAPVSRATWVTAHLLQLAGASGMVLELVMLSWAASPLGSSRLFAQLTTVFGASAIAVTATLQAVDGVALKATVDLWSQAVSSERPALLAAATAVRQIEIGLDGMFSLTLAATTLTFGLVLIHGTRWTRLLGVLAAVTAVTAAVGGVLFCLQGFSPAAMNTSTTSGALGIALTLAAAVWGWRRAAKSARPGDPRR